MLDAHLRPYIDPVLGKLALPFVRFGISANIITLSGGVVGLCACVATAFAAYHVALLLLCLNRICDGLDGTVARLTQPTDFGGFLDIVVDFLFYSLLPLSFAISRPEDSLAAAFLITSFVGTGTSFLAFAIIAEKRNTPLETPLSKSFFHLGGLIEGTETIILLALILIFPTWFGVLAFIFGSLCWVATGYRIISAWLVFGKGY